MLVRIILNETKKLFKHPYFWVLLAAFLFIFAVYFFGRAYNIQVEIRHGEDLTLGMAQDLQQGLALFSYIDVFIYAGIAALIFGTDYEERYLPAYLDRGVSRIVLILAKILFALLLAAVINICVFLLIFGLSALTEKLFLGQVFLNTLNIAAIFPVLLRTFCAAFPYIFITGLLAVVGRSMIFSAAGAFIYGTLGEFLVFQAAGKYPTVFRYFPSMLSESLNLFNVQLDVNALTPQIVEPFIPQGEAVLFLGLISIGLTLILTSIFSRQNFGG